MRMRQSVVRSAHNLLTAAALAGAVFAGSVAAQDRGGGDEVTLTLPQVRAVAREAVQNGDGKLAVLMARGLLQADPQDPYALFILARGLEMQKHHGAGRRAAGRAFSASEKDADRFMAAQMAARMAYADRRYGLAQYWLRRSLDPAPTEALKEQAISDFRRVRQENPWNTRYRITVQPTDNVNSGTENPYFVVDGLPWYGVHSPAAMALSGTEIRLEARSSYRLREDQASATRLTGEFVTKRVRLSQEAKDAAPGADGDDFASTRAEIGVDHRWAAGGDARANGVVGVTAAVGQAWYGGETSYAYGNVGLNRSFTLGENSLLSVRAEYERREDAVAYFARSDHVQLRGDFRHRLPQAAALSMGLILDRADSDRGNVDVLHRTAYVSYDFGDVTGPVDLRLTLGARNTDYPRYFIGFFEAPGGRQDDAVFASLDITFSEIDYAGFVPRVTLLTQRTSSNISRFETSSTALSFGIESKF